MGLTESAAVPPGYKQTEVGVIPEDWEVARLGDFCTCFSGGTPSTSNAAYYNGEIPWITSSDLNLAVINEVEGRITDEGLINSSAKMVKAGTLLLALYGATAGVAAMTEVSAAINQAVLAIQPKKHESKYLFEYLRLRKDFLIKTYTQGGQPNLSGEIVKSFLIALPPTKLEQQAIAEALSDADALIEGLEALITKKRRLKHGAMQELLKPSGNWLEKRLGEICNPSRERFSPAQGATERKCVELEHISSSTGSLLGFTSTSGLKSQKAIFRRGDVLFGKLRPYLKKYWFAEFDGVCSTEIWVLQTGSSIFSGWLYWLMQTDDVIDAANKSTGTKMPRAEWSTMKQMTIFVPPTFEEQIRTATVLSDMDAEIAVLEGKLAKARRVKAGMMQDLLTGRVRLI